MIKYNSRKNIRKFGELSYGERRAAWDIVNSLENAASSGLSRKEVLDLIKEAIGD